MTGTGRFRALIQNVLIVATILLISAAHSRAGGGLVLEDDVCIIWIDFYSAHFTAYQPDSRGNEQFCQELPDTGATLFVLDYLHQSLKEVPVELRIIRNVTGQGEYVKLKHVEQIENIAEHTVFHQPPVVRPDASFQVEMQFAERGEYIGIISAGHPSTDAVYTAVFPFVVGSSRLGWLLPSMLLLFGLAYIFIHRRRAGERVEADPRESP